MSRILIGIILLYRMTLGWIMGGHCRFHPTCSQYAIDAVNKYGAIRGTVKTVRRILRCHPFSDGGYDPA